MIRIGVIGYGYWGPNLVRNCFEAKEAQVACVSDLREDRLTLLNTRYPTVKTTRDSRDLIEDPSIDAVAIATPVSTHYELALRALQQGKHVLVEKPLRHHPGTAPHGGGALGDAQKVPVSPRKLSEPPRERARTKRGRDLAPVC